MMRNLLKKSILEHTFLKFVGLFVLFLYSLSSSADFKTDYYTVLGVSPSADQKEITRAYRLKSKQWHPDRNIHRFEEANREMAEINNAYDILKDPKKRSFYDDFLQTYSADDTIRRAYKEEKLKKDFMFHFGKACSEHINLLNRLFSFKMLEVMPMNLSFEQVIQLVDLILDDTETLDVRGAAFNLLKVKNAFAQLNSEQLDNLIAIALNKDFSRQKRFSALVMLSFCIPALDESKIKQIERLAKNYFVRKSVRESARDVVKKWNTFMKTQRSCSTAFISTSAP